MSVTTLNGCGFSGSALALPAPVALRGSVHGGQRPVSGASVQLYAAGSNGIGSAARPLLNTPVQSDGSGNFAIPATYQCPSASAPVYLMARGGNPGLSPGSQNPALALSAMLSSCGSLSGSVPISINEVTTVGTVWPLAAFMKSPNELGSTTGDPDFVAAVSSVNEFVKIADGTSPGVSTTESYFAENSKLYSLADVLDRCVDSEGGSAGDGSPCGALFSIATPPGGSAPTDTVTAAMRIAQSPENDVTPIFELSGAPAAFQPTLNAAPPDWTLSLSHRVATPSISLGTGTYIGSQQVTITDSTAGSAVHYTTDGTEPTSSSTQYSGPLSIRATSTVNAIAILGASQSSVASSTLTITTTHPPTQLAFRQQPTNALTQVAISPAVTVAIEDADGNLVSSAANPVKLSLSATATSLAGTLGATPQNGIATFSNLMVSTPGIGYTLSATSPGLTSATSTSFTISQPSTASTAISLALTPGNVTLTPSQTQTFTATVAGTSNTAVTWSLSPAVGSLSAAGLYTAPATVPYATAVVITATSVADSTKSESAQVTIITTVGATYYLAPAGAGGRDSNSGLSLSAPWLSPNHSVNCGDVILAAPSTTYNADNFTSGKWGPVACASGNNVAWLTCATFDGCKISGLASSQSGMAIGTSYWGIQGWEVDGTAISGPCFLAYPMGATPVTIHHIVFANDVADGCGGAGFSFDPATQSKPTKAGVDYIAVVGSIAYNAAGGSAYCATGIEVYEPIAADSLPGTHIYVAGNFSYANVEPASCGGGPPGDGEGIEFDTLDGEQTGTPMYSQQVVADNNMLLVNGGPGLEVFNNSTGTAPYSTIYLRHNTAWGNNAGPYQSVPAFAVAEVLILSAANVESFENIAATNAIDAAASNPRYSYWVSEGNGTDHVYQDVGYAVGGTVKGIQSSSGFSYGPNFIGGTNPNFANPVAPPAPSCTGTTSVQNCMASVIANFTPTNAPAKGYGYQVPSGSAVYDPLFPQWLCNVNLSPGIISMGCQTTP